MSSNFNEFEYTLSQDIMDDCHYDEIGTLLKFAIKNKYIYIPDSPDANRQRRYLYDDTLLDIIYSTNDMPRS